MRAEGWRKLKKLKLEWHLPSLGATIEQLLALNGKAADRGPQRRQSASRSKEGAERRAGTVMMKNGVLALLDGAVYPAQEVELRFSARAINKCVSSTRRTGG